LPTQFTKYSDCLPAKTQPDKEPNIYEFEYEMNETDLLYAEVIFTPAEHFMMVQRFKESFTCLAPSPLVASGSLPPPATQGEISYRILDKRGGSITLFRAHEA